ncbi:MAG: transposase [Bacteroidota bacterium]|nr:transposase [Bacteroidota bacterium]
MMEHPHLHCIMPAGGLSFDKGHWVHVEKENDFFVYYKILSRKFRGKFLAFLKQAYISGQLDFKGKLSLIAGKIKFQQFIDSLYKKEWVVNIQPPFGKAEKVLEYLSRYVFRVAITNNRIIAVKGGKVHFSWKDYRTGLFRKMKLGLDEFIRRFLLHVLPKGFFKVRYYGIFSSRYRKQNIETAKQHLSQEQSLANEEAIEDGRQVWVKQDTVWDEIMGWLKKYKKPNCPSCKKGRLRFAGIVPYERMAPG